MFQKYLSRPIERYEVESNLGNDLLSLGGLANLSIIYNQEQGYEDHRVDFVEHCCIFINEPCLDGLIANKPYLHGLTAKKPWYKWRFQDYRNMTKFMGEYGDGRLYQYDYDVRIIYHVVLHRMKVFNKINHRLAKQIIINTIADRRKDKRYCNVFFFMHLQLMHIAELDLDYEKFCPGILNKSSLKILWKEINDEWMDQCAIPKMIEWIENIEPVCYNTNENSELDQLFIKLKCHSVYG